MSPDQHGGAMRMVRAGLQLVTVCAAVVALSSCGGLASGTAISTHVLFIGNSFTAFNGGINEQLEGLAPWSETSLIAPGGYTLEQHWQEGAALQSIRQGGWQFVVLQEQSQTPVFDAGKFRRYARAFDMEIRRSGAQTILLMTWERPDSIDLGVTSANLAAAYNAAGKELGAMVAPAGVAFARSLRERPELALYGQDGHPTRDGTYLAACVLYAVMFGQSPIDNTYWDATVSADTAAYLQRIAAETVNIPAATGTRDDGTACDE
jgi:hypothetical protein